MSPALHASKCGQPTGVVISCRNCRKNITGGFGNQVAGSIVCIALIVSTACAQQAVKLIVGIGDRFTSYNIAHLADVAVRLVGVGKTERRVGRIRSAALYGSGINAQGHKPLGMGYIVVTILLNKGIAQFLIDHLPAGIVTLVSANWYYFSFR